MKQMPGVARRPMVASAGLVLGGALWGVFWIPLRGFEHFGLQGAWPGMLIYLAAALVLAPFAWRGRAVISRHWRGLAICGLSTGTAFSLYANSLMLTEVVRSILLFYLTPVWATLLGLVFLGERLTPPRVMALVLGLAGLVVILSDGAGLPLPRNIGDWMALASGMAWAFGSLQLYKLGSVAISHQVTAFVMGSLLAAAVVLLLGGQAMNGAPALATLSRAFPWALLTVLYLLPTLFLTLWPATLLSPGRVGLLLMGEVIIGVASAAAWSGEPFGLREAAGSVLIVSAGFVEVLGHRARPIEIRRQDI